LGLRTFKALSELSFAMKPEKDKKNVDVAPPGKISADISDSNNCQTTGAAIFICPLVQSMILKKCLRLLCSTVESSNKSKK